MITALLSFFDEPPELLYECLSRLGTIGVNRVIAVDGPYALYPHESVHSTKESVDAIRHAVDLYDMNLLLIQRESAWEGNEVGKRQRMMEIGRARRQPSAWRVRQEERNWLLVVDSDHFWEADDDLGRLLGVANDGVCFARVSFAEVFEPDGTPIYAPARPLMRARHDLRMGSNHYTYEIGSGDETRFSTFLERPEPTTSALDLTGIVRVVHKVHERESERRARQVSYYFERDTRKVET